LALTALKPADTADGCPNSRNAPAVGSATLGSRRNLAANGVASFGFRALDVCKAAVMNGWVYFPARRLGTRHPGPTLQLKTGHHGENFLFLPKLRGRALPISGPVSF
jgi:hypothetical protein